MADVLPRHDQLGRGTSGCAAAAERATPARVAVICTIGRQLVGDLAWIIEGLARVLSPRRIIHKRARPIDRFLINPSVSPVPPVTQKLNNSATNATNGREDVAVVKYPLINLLIHRLRGSHAPMSAAARRRTPVIYVCGRSNVRCTG